jgi:hypothetical protein
MFVIGSASLYVTKRRNATHDGREHRDSRNQRNTSKRNASLTTQTSSMPHATTTPTQRAHRRPPLGAVPPRTRACNRKVTHSAGRSTPAVHHYDATVLSTPTRHASLQGILTNVSCWYVAGHELTVSCSVQVSEALGGRSDEASAQAWQGTAIHIVECRYMTDSI